MAVHGTRSFRRAHHHEDLRTFNVIAIAKNTATPLHCPGSRWQGLSARKSLANARLVGDSSSLLHQKFYRALQFLDLRTWTGAGQVASTEFNLPARCRKATVIKSSCRTVDVQWHSCKTCTPSIEKTTAISLGTPVGCLSSIQPRLLRQEASKTEIEQADSINAKGRRAPNRAQQPSPARQRDWRALVHCTASRSCRPNSIPMFFGTPPAKTPWGAQGSSLTASLLDLGLCTGLIQHPLPPLAVPSFYSGLLSTCMSKHFY
jgi:hypothetical protein